MCAPHEGSHARVLTRRPGLACLRARCEAAARFGTECACETDGGASPGCWGERLLVLFAPSARPAWGSSPPPPPGPQLFVYNINADRLGSTHNGPNCRLQL